MYRSWKASSMGSDITAWRRFCSGRYNWQVRTGPVYGGSARRAKGEIHCTVWIIFITFWFRIFILCWWASSLPWCQHSWRRLRATRPVPTSWCPSCPRCPCPSAPTPCTSWWPALSASATPSCSPWPPPPTPSSTAPAASRLQTWWRLDSSWTLFAFWQHGSIKLLLQ